MNLEDFNDVFEHAFEIFDRTAPPAGGGAGDQWMLPF
jgi:hypothetical protein